MTNSTTAHFTTPLQKLVVEPIIQPNPLHAKISEQFAAGKRTVGINLTIGPCVQFMQGGTVPPRALAVNPASSLADNSRHKANFAL